MGLHLCVHCGSSYWEMLVAKIEHIIVGVLTVIVCVHKNPFVLYHYLHMFSVLAQLLAQLWAVTLGGNFGR